MKSLLILGTVAALVAVAPVAAAKSPAEIEQVAKAVSVDNDCRRGVGSEGIKLLKDSAGNSLILPSIQFRSVGGASQNEHRIYQVDLQGALADDNKAIALSKPREDAYSYLRLGNLKEAVHRDFQGALADYNKAISLNPKYADAYYSRGNVKWELNDPQGALADFNKVISLNPKYDDIYRLRGILKGDKLNDFQGALADFNKAISLDPKYAEVYYNRGNLKATKLNDRQGAISDLRTAARLFREQGDTRSPQKVVAALRKLGATEKP
jgi:tetratricopeptide (TPR) repeat protein